MSYEQGKDLPPAEFKRSYRVWPETFRRMVEVASLSESHISQEER